MTSLPTIGRELAIAVLVARVAGVSIEPEVNQKEPRVSGRKDMSAQSV
jgi:hypothetical protein